jgi:hypothetical protein
MTNKYNFFFNFKQTLTCTNHTFIQQISKGKSYKTSVHINKLHILHKMLKNNILKMNYNKKWVVLII